MCTYDNESRSVSYQCLFTCFLTVSFLRILNIALGYSLAGHSLFCLFSKAFCMLISKPTVIFLTVVRTWHVIATGGYNFHYTSCFHYTWCGLVFSLLSRQRNFHGIRWLIRLAGGSVVVRFVGPWSASCVPKVVAFLSCFSEIALSRPHCPLCWD